MTEQQQIEVNMLQALARIERRLDRLAGSVGIEKTETGDHPENEFHVIRYISADGARIAYFETGERGRKADGAVRIFAEVITLAHETYMVNTWGTPTEIDAHKLCIAFVGGGYRITQS